MNEESKKSELQLRYIVKKIVELSVEKKEIENKLKDFKRIFLFSTDVEEEITFKGYAISHQERMREIVDIKKMRDDDIFDDYTRETIYKMVAIKKP